METHFGFSIVLLPLGGQRLPGLQWELFMSRWNDNEADTSRQRRQTFKQEVEVHLKGRPPLLVLVELYCDGLDLFFSFLHQEKIAV